MGMGQFSKRGSETSDVAVASVAVVVYLALLVLLFIFVKFGVNPQEFVKQEASSGVLISFGDDNAGYGEKITKNIEVAKNIPEPKPTPAPTPEPDEMVENAVIEATSPEQEQQTDTEPEVVKPTINANALYKKTSSTSDKTTEEASSHGATKGADGMTGTKGGDTSSMGGGGTDNDFTLTGRQLLNGLAKPVYSERVSGRIEVEIQVDREGNVTSASLLPQNSNVSSRAVIEAVLEAARKTKFNKSETASFIQVGKIVYILKVE